MEDEQKLTGKTIVLTGATSGIGLETAVGLIKQGAYVIAAGRSMSRCEEAKDKINGICNVNKSGIHFNEPVFLPGDLSSMTQVRELSQKIIKAIKAKGKDSIDVLINNAGTFSSWYKNTEDGFELQFAVNHLAPFLLTHQLMPYLKTSTNGRIITVSSGSHYRTKIRWNDILMRRNYNCLAAYKQSKLANVLFTAELNRRLAHNKIENVCAYALDPGLVNTDIGLKGTGGFVKRIWKIRSGKGTSPCVPAASILYLAAEPSLQQCKDIYWKDCRPKPPSPYSLREDIALKLWEVSERMCSIESKDFGLYQY